MRVQEVRYAQERPSVTVSGTVAARTLVDLAFRVGGKVVARPVNAGDHVVAGQMLAQLDPSDLRLEVGIRENAVTAADAEAANLRAMFARYDKMGRTSSAFVESEYDSRRAAMRAADARLERAQRQLELARDQLQYTTLRADGDGVITALPVERGQVVAAGQKVASLAHGAEIEVMVDVPENRLGDLRAAQEVVITLWSAPERRFRGRVREIGALADPASRTFPVKISVLDAEGGGLALGMTAKAKFVGPPAPPFVALPAVALTEKQGKPAVWVLDESRHRAVLHPVEVLAYAGDGMVDIGAGLSPGQLVVTAGADLLDADLPVTAWRGPAR